MTIDTIHPCDGGCGRDIDALNDIPPVDNVIVLATAVTHDNNGRLRGYCTDCAKRIFPGYADAYHCLRRRVGATPPTCKKPRQGETQ